jgi:microtubule-associated protein, RP/EB family
VSPIHLLCHHHHRLRPSVSLSLPLFTVDYEYVTNYKVLQNVFGKQNIKKHVDVEKLCRGKYQDNLEFLQWMKNLWDVRYSGQDYDAVARREGAREKFSKGRNRRRANATRPTSGNATRGRGAARGRGGAARRGGRRGGAARGGASRRAAEAPVSSGSSNAQHAADLAALNDRLSKLRVTIEGLEKERNFYFGKLREIEVLCQTDDTKDAETKSKILEILYATDDDFETPQEADEDAEEPVGDDIQDDGVMDDLDVDADHEEDYEEEEDDEEQTF